MIEEWKEIDNYEGLYEVSNLGRVKSLGNDKTRKEKILKARKDGGGYLQVSLCRNGKVKTLKTHRLVAAAFIDNPQNLPEINHRDEDKTNNCVGNLEWCDGTYNCNYGTRNKRVGKVNTNRKDLSKRVLCVETGEIFPSTMEVQRKLGFDNVNIGKCCNGRYKQAYGYTWRYVD